MITVRRAGDRRHVQRGSKDVWLTFFRETGAGKTLAGGFGALQSLDESRLPPRGTSRNHPKSESDSVSYVQEGTLAFVNSVGHSGVVQAGEFQRITGASQVRHRETNASNDESVHVFRMGLGGSRDDLEPSHEEKRFSVADRRGVLCVVASLDARLGSLRLNQDVQIYSTVLHQGQHVVHELCPSRRAWIHVVEGAVVLGEVVLRIGDGAGITGERAVSATALVASELLLLDLEDDEPESGNEDHTA
jgi:quercetin 2,3-dioxygenase